MYTLKLALSLLHPGPFQLSTATSNVLMTYKVDNFISKSSEIRKMSWTIEIW